MGGNHELSMQQIKQIINIINRLLLLGVKPSDRLSDKWREDELSRYEYESDKAAGLL